MAQVIMLYRNIKWEKQLVQKEVHGVIDMDDLSKKASDTDKKRLKQKLLMLPYY